ncbi:MAG: flagellar biosynthetic protein FliR [Alphaproteobacteria bacterium]|nr:flagellar biosynthetic protein FliR [Alphaproteobacteria bacterium]
MELFGVDLWATALVFARVGAMLMLFPAFGEPTIPAPIRLTFALLVTAVLAPALQDQFAAAPAQFGAAIGALIGETLIGIALGAVAQILTSTLATAGQILGMETGLSYAQTADPTAAGTGQVLSVFLGLLGVTLVFAADLHHVFLRALVDSYALFKPASPLAVGDISQLGVRAVGDSFRIALQMTAPVIFAGLIFRIGLGVLSRLIPQIQVFFVAMSVNVLGGFMIAALALSAGMLLWLDRLDQFATTLR